MTIITEGEASDFRIRMGLLERRISETELRTSVHEQKCAGRYQLILMLLAANLAINVPTAWPHIAAILGFIK